MLSYIAIYIYIIIYRSMTFTYTYEASPCSRVHEQKAHAYIMAGHVDRLGYDSQLKYNICDACRPCHSTENSEHTY